MAKYTAQEIDDLIEQAAERAGKRLTLVVERNAANTDQKIAALDTQTEKKINEAAERAAGFYYEKTRHHIDLVLESTDFIRERLKDMVTRDEFNELKGEVKIIRQVVTDTNRDLHKLENTVYHA